jgi:hypothetical protein
MGGCWFVALLLAAPAAPPAGPGALRARLTLLDAQPALGQPVRLRLELTNTSESRITYDAEQVPTSDVLDVWGPEGRRVPHVHEPVQTGEQASSLDPGRTATLFDGFDLAEHYHLATGGRYRVRFSGRALQLSPDPPPLSSNVLEIELRPGRRPPATEVVERLLPIVPRGWQLVRTEGPGKIEVVLTGLVRSKRDQARVVLSLTDSRPTAEARPWGRTEWGKLWVMVNAKARGAWPAHRKAIAGALGVLPEM